VVNATGGGPRHPVDAVALIRVTGTAPADLVDETVENRQAQSARVVCRRPQPLEQQPQGVVVPSPAPFRGPASRPSTPSAVAR
jgi:hypothetical protein